MRPERRKGRRCALLATSCWLALSAPPPATAQAPPEPPTLAPPAPQAAEDPGPPGAPEAAPTQLEKAAEVVRQMGLDTRFAALMRQARGIFIVPNYSRLARAAGVAEEPGVLVLQRDGEWRGPAFYRLGGVRVGVLDEVSTGRMALLLMTDRAVAAFASARPFALSAAAGYRLIDYATLRQKAPRRWDVVLWSDSEGLFTLAAVAFDDIRWDPAAARAFYGRDVTPAGILGGQVPSGEAGPLLEALPRRRPAARGGW